MNDSDLREKHSGAAPAPSACALCGKEGASYQMDSAIPYCDEACFEADNEQEGDADDE